MDCRQAVFVDGHIGLTDLAHVSISCNQTGELAKTVNDCQQCYSSALHAGTVLDL